MCNVTTLEKFYRPTSSTSNKYRPILSLYHGHRLARLFFDGWGLLSFTPNIVANKRLGSFRRVTQRAARS